MVSKPMVSGFAGLNPTYKVPSLRDSETLFVDCSPYPAMNYRATILVSLWDTQDLGA